MKIIPLSALASQTLNTILGNQNCQFAVYQKNTGLYLDLSVNNAPISTTVRCVVNARLLLDRGYLGFVGDIGFVDTQGTDDPLYTGLGSRWLLIYLEVADLAAN